MTESHLCSKLRSSPRIKDLFVWAQDLAGQEVYQSGKHILILGAQCCAAIHRNHVKSS